MKILLDIDDTLIDSKEKVHSRAHLLFRNHNVVLYSASEDIEFWAKKFKVNYISKHSTERPAADILIDDDKYFEKMVDVKKYYSSIDNFLNSVEV